MFYNLERDSGCFLDGSSPVLLPNVAHKDEISPLLGT